MSPDPELRSLKALAARLPFDLDDADAAGAAFARWRKGARETDRETVELWTYCFVRRYFLQKFVRHPGHQPSDFDALVEKAFLRAQQASGAVEDPSRYASWVSVICKNAYINFIRAGNPVLPLREDAEEFMAADPEPRPLVDTGAVHRAVGAAVKRLPGFLQDAARLRFLEQRSYEEISHATGHPLPVIRSYVSKSIARFREDAHLRLAVERATDDIFAT